MCRVAHGDASHPYRAPRTDFTACTILERFGNEQTSASVERVLKQLATEKATEILKVSHNAIGMPAHSHASHRHESLVYRRTPSSLRTLEHSVAVRPIYLSLCAVLIRF